MRVWAMVVGAVVAIAGIVWFLQGVDLLPGSFMTGSARWAVIGGVCIVVGAGLVYWGARAPAKSGGA